MLGCLRRGAGGTRALALLWRPHRRYTAARRTAAAAAAAAAGVAACCTAAPILVVHCDGNERSTRVPLPRPGLNNDERSTIEVFNASAPAVAFITNLSLQAGPFSAYHDNAVPQGSGSGFMWDSHGHIVTNFHVVQGASRLAVTLADAAVPYTASIVGCDPERDIAVLKIRPPRGLTPLPIGTSHDLQVHTARLRSGIVYTTRTSRRNHA